MSPGVATVRVTIPIDVGTVEYVPARVSVPPSITKPFFGWATVLFPSIVAVISWPILFVIFFVMSFTLALMAVSGCLIWAWHVSDRLATWSYWRRVQSSIVGEYAQPRRRYRAHLRMALFLSQTVGILSSCPIFWMALTLSRHHGIAPQFWWVGRRLLMRQ